MNNRVLLYAMIGIIVVLGCGMPASVATPGSEPGDVPPTQAVVAEPTEAPSSVTPQPALPERRRLTLEFPPRIRAGDSDVVRLTLEVDERGNLTPTAQVDGNVITGEVIEIPNLYETHHVVAEARFDIAGMEVRPAELISEPLAPGTSAAFFWSIRPPDVGFYRGTIWLHLRFVEKSTGEESRKAVSAQIVDIEATHLLGFSANVVRTTGILGSIVGTVLGFPFLEDILKFFLKRRNK